MQSVTIKNVKQ